MYLRGVPKGQIATAVEVCANTITDDIKWLEALWRKELLDDPVEVKARELAGLYEMEREAINHLTGYNILKKGEPITIIGDGRWWDRWLNVKKRIAEMLGLDAPVKSELTGKDGGPLEFVLALGEDDDSNDRD